MITDAYEKLSWENYKVVRAICFMNCLYLIGKTISHKKLEHLIVQVVPKNA